MKPQRKKKRTSPVRDRLETLKTQKKTALMPFLTIGWPDPDSFVEMAVAVADGGADVMELGMPFSDPVADGPVIQKTSFEALSQGLTFARGLELIRRVADRVKIPLVLMTYYNPLLRGGLEDRCQAIAAAGIKGLVVPDLPPEEGAALQKAADGHDLDVTYLCAPTSSRARMQLVCLHSRGFLYLVSSLGVTGAREDLPPRLAEFIAEVRRYTVLPLCVGFGISTPDQARAVAKLADGCIVGSALLNACMQAAPSERVATAKSFTQQLRGALDALTRERSAARR